jgi:hypothetical protein
MTEAERQAKAKARVERWRVRLKAEHLATARAKQTLTELYPDRYATLLEAERRNLGLMP